jgi:hypothetical protein
MNSSGRETPRSEVLLQRGIENSDGVDAAIEDVEQFLKKAFHKGMGGGRNVRRRLLHLRCLRAAEGPFCPAALQFGGTEAHPLVYDDSKAAWVLESARLGDSDADSVLCEFAASFIIRGRNMPLHLREYIGIRLLELAAIDETTPSKKQRGPKIHSKFRRNFLIARAVADVVSRGFHATRNDDGAERECACSIVAAALKRLNIKLGYHGVAKIWTEHAHWAEGPGAR